MPYTYDKSPGGDRLTVTGCDMHGGIIVTTHAASGKSAVPVCIAGEDVREVAREMLAWAGLRASAAELAGTPDRRPQPVPLDGCTCGGIGDTGAHRAGCAWSDR